MPSEHSCFSPSSADRIIHCTGSYLLSSDLPDKESAAMREGTEAHDRAEYEVLLAWGTPREDAPVEGEFFCEEMALAAKGYSSYVMEIAQSQLSSGEDVQLFTEQKLWFDWWVDGAFGTSDCMIITSHRAWIIDFKYGRGHVVDAEKNTQLMCYGLGLLQTFGDLFELEQITLCIYQPRRENFSEWSISVPDLLKWGEEILRPAAKAAMSGQGDFHEGDWCWTCKAKYQCTARSEANLELARLEFKESALLNDDEMEEVLDRADRIAAWAADVKEFAFQQALSGKIWKNWKLVEGRSNRRWKDESGAASVLQNEGIEPYDHKIVGITELEKTLGKKRFSELLSAFVEKPKGKPTLVRNSDKRKPITL